MKPSVSTWRLRLHRAMVAFALAWCTLPYGMASSAEPPIAYRRIVAYRRILVPADSPSTWPREGEAFLPVESSDFEAWVAAANEPPSMASIADARYEARLVNDQLVDCRGRWQVQLRGDQPARLPIGAASITIRDPRWLGEPTPPSSSARLGWWPGADGKGLGHVLEVPRTGALEFGWDAPATAIAAGELEYMLKFPVAAKTQLILDVPAGKRPVVENCAVLKSPPRPDEGGRWELALRPAALTLLRFESTAPKAAPRVSPISIRSELRYNVSKRGVELQATLTLAATERPNDELKVNLPAGLQLVEASAGGESLLWQVAPLENSGGLTRATIQVPASALDQARVVTLRAWGPLVIDKSQRLPMLVADDTFWSSGTIELALDETLDLGKLAPIDCVQTAVETATKDSTATHCYRFNAFSPSASVEISLAHRRPIGNVSMGTSLEVGNSGVAARLVADVSVDRGSLHKLTADVQSGWSIDSVETVPAGALGEWYVDQAGNVQTLDLQLTRAIAPGQNLRVVLTARRDRAQALEPLSMAKMNPLAWRDLIARRSLLQIRAAEQFELESVGELPWVAAASLTPRERTLFASSAAGRLCEGAASDSNAAIRLAPKKGAYDATVQLDAELSAGRLQQRFRIECRPQGGGIDHVLVYLSQAASEPLVWTLDETHEPLVAERMPTSDPRLRGLPPGGELWLLHLRRLYARPIVISANSSTPWRERQRILLVSAPDAASQQGRITISTTANEIPTIVAQGMSPTPLPIKPVVESTTDPEREVRAVYRFQPTRLYDAGSTAQLWLGPAMVEAEDAKLLATRVDITSRYSADGLGVHRVVCQLENRGAGAATFMLPDGVSLESARVDGQLVNGHRAGAISIPLSLQRPTSALELMLLTRGERLANGSQVSPPLPLEELTILAGHWNISVPQGFVACGDGRLKNDAAIGWCERLFGPLARPRDEAVFNPLVGGHWNKVWAELSRASATPAEAADTATAPEQPMPSGWNSFEVEFLSEPPPSLTLTHRPATTALALAVFLACAVGAVLCGVRGITLALVALGTATVALLLPALYAPLATAATLGFLVAALGRWWQRRIDLRQSPAAILAMAFMLAAAESNAAPPAATVERVLVPIDARGEPVGTKVFVGDEFLRQLLAAAEKRSAAGDWLLTKMSLDGELARGQDRATVRCGVWQLTFEIDTLARDTKVTLPLARAEADWPKSASLDGMPATIEWDEAGGGCHIQVAEPGPHRLSIALEPHTSNTNGRQLLELTLPQAAGAPVSIATPTELPDLRTTGAREATRGAESRTSWHGDLDGTGSFTASWPVESSGGALTQRESVDELRWLRLGPDSRVLEVKYLLRSGGNWPDAIELAVDPDWALLGGDVEPAESTPEHLIDGRQRLRIRTTPTDRHNPRLTLRFRARDASPLGRFRLPNVELTSLPVENCWFAVSCDPSLECVPSAATTPSAALPADLATGFNPPNGPTPQILTNAARLDANWFLHIRPRVELSKVRAQLALLAGKDRCRIEYSSDVSPKLADRFGWSLAVPEDLAVDRITVTSAGVEVPADWVRSTANRVTMFFDREVTEPYQLRLVGSVPVEEGGQFALPAIEPAAQPPAIERVALYRKESVLASWQLPEATHWSDADASESPPFGPEAAFVKAWSVDEPSAGRVFVQIETNEPIVGGDTLTTVSRDSGAWSATWTCDLQIEQGELDVLRLTLPSNWSGPFEVVPAMTTKIDAASEPGGTATLSIQLPQSARPGDPLKVSVRAPLALADGEMPVAPEISLATDGERRNFLALPETLDGEAADWSRRGIELAALPLALRPAASTQKNLVTYRMSDAINVSLRPRAPHAASANVELAETAIHIDAAGRMFAITRFVLAPEGLDHCDVELPAGQRMVRMALDGHPALARAIDPRHWQVQLGAPSLPQKLDIVTQATEPSAFSATSVEASRPILKQSEKPIPIDLSLWTIHHAAQEGTPRITGGALVTPSELATARLDRLVSVSQTATRSVVEAPVVDGTSWFARWAEDLRTAEELAGSLERTAVAATETIRVPQSADNYVSETVARSHAWLEQITDAFSATEPLAVELEPDEREPNRRNAFDPWQAAQQESANQVCFISDGDQNRAVVEWVPDGLTPAGSRSLALASFAVLACGLVWLKRTPHVRELVESWPEVAWLLLGVAAWMWLRPSVVGCLVAAVSAAFLLARIARETKITKARPPQPTELDSEGTGET
jgi:hypothetical protein